MMDFVTVVFFVCVTVFFVFGVFSLLFYLLSLLKVYVLFKVDDQSFIGAFGDKDEVISFFWSLCDETKDILKVPMYKTHSFRAVCFYLKTLGYDIIRISPEDIDGKFNR